MEKHFMLDIESTGIDPGSEELLQVGLLEVDFVDGYWVPGRDYEMTHHTDRKPESSFAKEHQAALYEKCNAAPVIPVEVSRDTILSFLKDCGVNPPDVYLMGWNASNFDVPFLVEKKHLRRSTYVIGPDGKDIRVGDFHYRIYELGGAISLAQNVLGCADREQLIEAAKAAYPMPAREGREHDALFDCYEQLRILNGLIKLMRK